VLFQFKQPWIFFSLPFMEFIHNYISKQTPNNSVLLGLSPVSRKDRKTEIAKGILIDIFKAIVIKFVSLQSTNLFLGLESIFKFTS
jgi:hypothetical protein